MFHTTTFARTCYTLGRKFWGLKLRRQERTTSVSLLILYIMAVCCLHKCTQEKICTLLI